MRERYFACIVLFAVILIVVRSIAAIFFGGYDALASSIASLISIASIISLVGAGFGLASIRFVAMLDDYLKCNKTRLALSLGLNVFLLFIFVAFCLALTYAYIMLRLTTGQ